MDREIWMKLVRADYAAPQPERKVIPERRDE
jgi:hypothetical protein